MRLPAALTLALPLTALWLALPAGAQGPAVADKPGASAKVKPATPRQQLKNEAKGLALATETAEDISEAQLAVAARVLTGTADCEFNQRISVTPVEGHPGHFTIDRVGQKGQRYRMTPRETETGAVRLEDRVHGVVWIQIPAKSMLMNARLGQRMVDSCQLDTQRVAVHQAGSGIGIVPSAAAVTTAQAPVLAAAPATAASAP